METVVIHPLDAYNHVVKHRQDYLTLLQEAPQLIPLYALLADDLDKAGEVRHPEPGA